MNDQVEGAAKVAEAVVTKSDVPVQPEVTSQTPAVIEPRQRSEKIVVSSDVPVLDTGLFEQMTRIAKIMAVSSLVPEHLNKQYKVSGQMVRLTLEEAIANCFLVVNQSVRWRMDPFAVAQGVYVTKGRVGYEGKLIAAVINSHPNLSQRLSYAYSGNPGKDDRKVVVSGRVKGDTVDRVIDGTIGGWSTDNESWKKIPDQMLSYRGAREWARRWMPEAILGVFADEEVQQIERDVTPVPEKKRVERSASARLAAAVGAGGQNQAPAATSDQGASGTTGTTIDAPTQPEISLELAIQGLASCANTGMISGYSDELPETIRADDRLAEIKGAQRDSGGKAAGTPKMRKVYAEKMTACADAETLEVIYDETRGFIWGKDDQTAIASAYDARMGELRPKE